MNAALMFRSFESSSTVLAMQYMEVFNSSLSAHVDGTSCKFVADLQVSGKSSTRGSSGCIGCVMPSLQPFEQSGDFLEQTEVS